MSYNVVTHPCLDSVRLHYRKLSGRFLPSSLQLLNYFSEPLLLRPKCQPPQPRSKNPTPGLLFSQLKQLQSVESDAQSANNPLPPLLQFHIPC